jgi:hypothetical protein
LLSPAPRRLPGIRFEAAPPAPVEVLPRMDIAGFVGFAAAGPIDVPVAVEDAAEFAAVFGDDAPLAVDPARRETVVAQLAPAVRAFFANGGRRCWVVRVAGTTADSNVFELPGIARVRADGQIRPATLLARSPGSWSDGLRAATAVLATPLPLEDVDIGAGTFDTLVPEPGALRVGDLVRLRFARSALTLLAVVDEVKPKEGSRLAVRARDQRWFLAPARLPAGRIGHVHFLGERAVEHQLDARVAASAADGELRLELAATPAQAPREGALVRAIFGTRRAYLQARSIDAAAKGLVLTGTAYTIGTSPQQAAAPRGVIERLELAVRVSGGAGLDSALTVGFSPKHPHFAGALPDDARRYGVPERPADLEASAFAGRFPLAGAGASDRSLLPLADAGAPLGALRPRGLERYRDGLETLDLGLFVDPDLARVSAARLIAEADWIRDQRPAPRALRGIHALLANDEVTLLAVPDAAQRDWVRARIGRAREPVPPPGPPEPDWASFLDCSTHVPAAPLLGQTGDEDTGAFTLEWTASDVADAEYELQESTDAGMDGAETLYRGPERSFDVYGRPSGSILYYQVRALAGTNAGGWSNRVRVRSTAPVGWELRPAREYIPGPLLELQRALLRMCAARGDLLCVLSLPEHYREREAIAHAASLAERDPAVPGEDPPLGYGALYHPWLNAVAPERPATLRRQTPDGAVTGVIATRSAERGAWIAPANVALRDVLALTTPIGAGAHQALQDARVNLVRREPGGFQCLCADTLTPDGELRPIGTRRLLQTLRRLAVRHGATLTFEDNDDVTRRAVRRSFEELLEIMFERGAFAGARASEGFEVATPVGSGDVDGGRLVVELRVAPARPLEFITVRLVRTGTGRLSVEAEAA